MKTECICTEVIKQPSVSELRSKYLTYFISLNDRGLLLKIISFVYFRIYKSLYTYIRFSICSFDFFIPTTLFLIMCFLPMLTRIQVTPTQNYYHFGDVTTLFNSVPILTATLIQ